MDVLKKLKQLKELDAQAQVVKIDKQAAIDAVLTEEIKAKLAAIDAEFNPILDGIAEASQVVEAEIKVGVLAHGKTVKGAYTAVYNKPRVTWDTKALDGYAVAHPEIEAFRKISKPSISIRRK